MPLDPSLNVDGNPDWVKVSATDVAASSDCGLFLMLKTRPSVKVVDGWRRLYAPRGEGVPLPVVSIVDLIVEAHNHNFGTYEAQARWLDDAIVRHKIHRLLQAYIRLTVDNVLEAHESIEAELGPMRLLAENSSIGTWNRQLAAWGPCTRQPTGFARFAGSATVRRAGTRIVKSGRLLQRTLLQLPVNLFRPGGSASPRLARWMAAAQSCSMVLPRTLVPTI